MDRHLNHINGLLIDWGCWLKAGQTSQGVFSTSVWPEGRPVEAHTRLKQRKPLVPVPSPKETRITRHKVPCLRIAYREERMHRAVVLLPETYHPIICCLYLNGCSFYDTGLLLGTTSKKVGKLRYKLLVSINNMLSLG